MIAFRPTSVRISRRRSARRDATAHHLRERYGVEYEGEREILITVGVSEGLDLALLPEISRRRTQMTMTDRAYEALGLERLQGAVEQWTRPKRRSFLSQWDNWFAIGVQWQPASPSASGLDIQVFRALIDAAVARTGATQPSRKMAIAG